MHCKQIGPHQPHGREILGFGDSMGILWELQTMEIRFVIVQNC